MNISPNELLFSSVPDRHAGSLDASCGPIANANPEAKNVTRELNSRSDSPKRPGSARAVQLRRDVLIAATAPTAGLAVTTSRDVRGEMANNLPLTPGTIAHISSQQSIDAIAGSSQVSGSEESAERKIANTLFGDVDILLKSDFEARKAQLRNISDNALRPSAAANMRVIGKDQKQLSPKALSRQHWQNTSKVDNVLQKDGWIHPHVAGNVSWEPGRGPLLIKKGLSLQQLSMCKRNIARGVSGSVSILENEKGQKIIAKMLKQNVQDLVDRGLDDLTLELQGFQKVYQSNVAGLHRNLVNVYGIATVRIESSDERVLLMDHIVGPTGHSAFKDLRQCWKAGKISTEEYFSAVQFIGRRLFDVTAHLGKAGVVHNDIKPGNFLIETATGEPVVIDLGLWSSTGTMARGGTDKFKSPEARLYGDVDESSDVFTVVASILHGIESALNNSIIQQVAGSGLHKFNLFMIRRRFCPAPQRTA